MKRGKNTEANSSVGRYNIDSCTCDTCWYFRRYVPGQMIARAASKQAVKDNLIIYFQP